jgi:hypothetical protein
MMDAVSLDDTCHVLEQLPGIGSFLSGILSGECACLAEDYDLSPAQENSYRIGDYGERHLICLVRAYARAYACACTSACSCVCVCVCVCVRVFVCM